MSSRIIIENYSQEWPLVFQRLKAVFERIPGNLVSEIHHVGSTSVKGLASKPVIDIDIIIDNRDVLPGLISALEKIGYKYMGDLGISGREAFLQGSEKSPYDGSNSQWPIHHLYVCTKDNIAFQNHIKFRDYLRQNPVKAAEYGELKKELAAAHESDRNLYVEKKTGFIIDALREMGLEENHLNEITNQNKIK
jgi:GrpB-like predicted nucleotidyltransferase (UPF0157 family)